jgi:hypothetical protein
MITLLFVICETLILMMSMVIDRQVNSALSIRGRILRLWFENSLEIIPVTIWN